MKVSLYLSDELWAKFKKTVLRQTGDARSLSSKVQELIQGSMLEESVIRGFEGMEISPKLLDSGHVVPVRPSVPTSSGETIREMRDSRHAKSVPR